LSASHPKEATLSEPLFVTHDGPILTITLDRPDRRNPLSLETIRALRTAIDERDARVIVIASTGPAFSAGHDLREMRDRDEAFYDELFRECGELMLAIHHAPQPVIAQVQGVATAAGCQLVAACDLAVASEAATFATPGVRIGLFCTTPMVEVARAVGRKRAMQMLLTGDPIDAATAAGWGLVNAVVPAADLAETTMALARRIATASSLVLATGKRAFHANLDLALDEAYEQAGGVMSRCSSTADAQEGFAAFLEKRSPVWTGGSN
jgi:enoyl-CoA hydratase/carnithine racemase